MEAKTTLKIAKRRFVIVLSIYALGTIGGIIICLLEACGRIKYRNYSRLPLWEGKLILASNHPGWLDIVILPLLYFPWWFTELGSRTRDLFTWPVRRKKRKSISSVLNEEFKQIPVSTADRYNFRHFAWILEGWNIFIDRKDNDIGSRGGALKKAVEILDNDGRIVIFPGGGRDFKAVANGDGIYNINTKELILRKPRPGIGWIVKQTGATVVPIRLEGTDKVLPNKNNEKLPPFLRFERYFLRFWHPITVTIGEPLRFPTGIDEDTVLEHFIQAQLEMHYNGKEKTDSYSYLQSVTCYREKETANR
jgi:1-acyl-sn-glycerol-3-phosphate acyltransferase